MVETVVEHLWRERAVEKGFPTSLITISYLLNPKVQASEDVMSKRLLRMRRFSVWKSQEHGDPRKAAPKRNTRVWLGGVRENSNDAERR